MSIFHPKGAQTQIFQTLICHLNHQCEKWWSHIHVLTGTPLTSLSSTDWNLRRPCQQEVSSCLFCRATWVYASCWRNRFLCNYISRTHYISLQHTVRTEFKIVKAQGQHTYMVVLKNLNNNILSINKCKTHVKNICCKWSNIQHTKVTQYTLVCSTQVEKYGVMPINAKPHVYTLNAHFTHRIHSYTLTLFFFTVVFRTKYFKKRTLSL